jgi:phage-related protein
MADYTVKIRNQNDEIIQVYPSDDFILAGITGLTPADAIINATEMATIDGSRFNSSHVNARNIVIELKPRGEGTKVRKSRVNLYRYVKTKQKIRLYISNDQRDVYIDGYVERLDDAGSIFSEDQRLQISVICPDPFFRDYSSDEEEIVFSSTEALFHFPFYIEEDYPIPFSVRLNSQYKTIYNAGDTACGMILKVAAYGAVSNPKFFDEANNDTMTFNLNLQTGDELIVTTIRGQKSAILRRNGVETNVINTMTHDSSWLVLEPGDNIFYYAADSGFDNLTLTFIFTNLYEGI